MAERKFRVVVAGAGVSASLWPTLKRAGINVPYTRRPPSWRTWRDNTFPAFCRCLVAAIRFPFQPNYDWSRTYAPAEEIWAYIKKVAHDRGLKNSSAFNEEITAARFTGGRWHLETAKGDADVADVFVCATGLVCVRPPLHDIAGRDGYAGAASHSAHWDHSVPYCRTTLGVDRRRRQRRAVLAEASAWATGVKVTQLPAAPNRCAFANPLDLARAPETPAAVRLPQGAGPALGVHQQIRPVAPRPGPQREAMDASTARSSTSSRTPS